jgi:iron complex outermembrane receptor protein
MASKTGVAPTSVLGRKNVSTGKYVDLGDTCSAIGDMFGGSTVKYTAKAGSYCASPKVGPTYWTTQTKNSSQNVFGSANTSCRRKPRCTPKRCSARTAARRTPAARRGLRAR